MRNLRISSLMSTGASPPDLLNSEDHQSNGNKHHQLSSSSSLFPGTSLMPWPSLSTRLKGENYLVGNHNCKCHHQQFNINNMMIQHRHHHILRLGLPLTMDESLEDVQICENPEAPISTRIAAIRWILFFNIVIHRKFIITYLPLSPSSSFGSGVYGRMKRV